MRRKNDGYFSFLSMPVLRHFHIKLKRRWGNEPRIKSTKGLQTGGKNLVQAP